VAGRPFSVSGSCGTHVVLLGGRGRVFSVCPPVSPSAIYTQEGYAVRTNGAVIALLSFSVSDRRYRVAFGAINVS